MDSSLNTLEAILKLMEKYRLLEYSDKTYVLSRERSLVQPTEYTGGIVDNTTGGVEYKSVYDDPNLFPGGQIPAFTKPDKG